MFVCECVFICTCACMHVQLWECMVCCVCTNAHIHVYHMCICVSVEPYMSLWGKYAHAERLKTPLVGKNGKERVCCADTVVEI